MSLLHQRTISQKFKVTGIGLHSGKKVSLTLYPSVADFGIQFKRTDIPGSPLMRASALSVGATENNTTLGAGPFAIHTVEHLLAVFYGLGVDNVYIEIDGPEIPSMDGSGAPFIFLLKEVGLAKVEKVKKFLIILRPVRVEVDDKWAEIIPAPRLIIDSTIVFPHPKIKTQREVFEFSCENFITQISRARTFGMLKDVDMLKRKGLAKGGTLDNAIVLDDYKILNPDGLRMPNEFVRHKILDTIGDISLLGHEVVGKITTYKSGHNLHNKLCRKLLETEGAFEIIPATAINEEFQNFFSVPLALQNSV